MTTDLSQTFSLPDGRTLTYAEYGLPNGKPVFYFHGIAGSRLEPAMLDVKAFEKAGIRLIAPDRPGMGGSDFQPGRQLSHWPEDILKLADALALGKFGVFGVSGGAGYVSACARLIPDRLSAAVIVSGAGCMDSPEARAGLPVMGWVLWWVAARSVRLTHLLLNVTKPRNLADPAKIRHQIDRSMLPVDAAVFEVPGRLEAFIASGVESMRQGVHGIVWDTHLCARPWDFRLKEICFPVRLLHGEADRNVPVEVARKVAITIPRCQATFYPGEGHFSTLVNHLDEAVFALQNASRPRDEMKDSSPLQSGHYEIRIKEPIGEKWLAWFDEFAVTPSSSGETLLKGLIRDQAALHGLLAKIRDLNLTLVSINRVERDKG